MAFFTSKVWHVVYVFFSLVFNLVNCYFSNIISFEIENSSPFPWKLLLTNKLFIIWIFITVAYIVLSIVLTKTETETNEEVAYNKIYDDVHKEMINGAKDAYLHSHFEDGDKMLAGLKEIEKARVDFSPKTRRKKNKAKSKSRKKRKGRK